MNKVFRCQATALLSLVIFASAELLASEELPAQGVTLQYSEEKVIPADPPRDCGGGGGLLGALEGVTCEMDNVGTTMEDRVEVSTATLQMEVTPVIIVPEAGQDYRLAFKVRGGSVGYDGEISEQAKTYVNADSRLVKSRLARWSTTFTEEQLAALRAGEPIEMPVTRPFEGLQRLSLTEALNVPVNPPLPGAFHTDIEPMLNWAAEGSTWFAPQQSSSGG